MENLAVMLWAIVGATLIGIWAGSPMLGIGVYCCIAATGGWKS